MPSEDVIKTLSEDQILKFYLYMGHTVIFMNQNNSIKNVMTKINDYSSVWVVVMDFKMNFETMKHCDNSVENFGKRGLSWNGALVFCSIRVYVETDVYEMRQETMYINHINTFYHKQDAAYFLSIIEAILNSIKRIFPDITRVIMQSDNARLYQNSIVPFFIHMLSI